MSDFNPSHQANQITDLLQQILEGQKQMGERLTALEAKTSQGGGMSGLGFGYVTEDVAQALEHQRELEPARLVDGRSKEQEENRLLSTPLGEPMPESQHRGVIVVGNTSGRSRIANGEFKDLFGG